MKINNITKKYGKTEVLKNISLEIREREKIAILGSNGTGKSTLMNIINKTLTASSGNIDYEGMELTSKNTAYIMQNMTLPNDAKVSEVIELFAQNQKNLENGKRLIKEFRMEDFLDRKYSSLSGGQKQKLFLVSAIQNQPEYFFFDEITTGLDSESREELFQFFSQDHHVQKTTLVLVTHYLEEALQICNRFVILKDGKITADLTKKDLVDEDYCFVTFDESISEYEPYKLEESYKLPKHLQEEMFRKYQSHIVNYERDYRMNLGGLLQ
ncbi:MAG: ABC transporter ATP-binding protein [Streptococcaceae bacterium]|nr:ABC transporter ATP-binding protein [Streptococcaceae bacterium]MCL2681178.1 ABC transporter ATP-binding protein [Streptococcaceae bacterium]MCL2858431.1 ABC transporter ATP-binding protein [Streptococcaceae bacterium]